MHEFRRHDRTTVSLRPRYRVATSLEYTESPCLDLSEGGMFIESPLPPKPGTLVKIQCRSVTGALDVLGEVAWRRTNGESEPSGMGIRFLKLESEGAEIVRGLIASSRLTQAAAIPIQQQNTWISVAALMLMLVGAFFLAIGAR